MIVEDPSYPLMLARCHDGPVRLPALQRAARVASLSLSTVDRGWLARPATSWRNTTMMLDWNAYQQQLMTSIAQIGRISPDTVRGYRELSDAGAKTRKLDAKTREL